MRAWPAALLLLVRCSPAPAPRSAARASAPVYVAPTPADAGAATDASVPPSDTTGDPGPVAWGNDVDAALAQSGSDARHVLVFFSAAWAMASTELERTTLSSPAIRRRLNRSYHAVKVDLTDEQGPGHKLADRFHVSGVPMLLVLDSSGRELDRVTGYVTADKLLARLR